MNEADNEAERYAQACIDANISPRDALLKLSSNWDAILADRRRNAQQEFLTLLDKEK